MAGSGSRPAGLVPKLTKPSPLLGVLLALEGDGLVLGIAWRLLAEEPSKKLIMFGQSALEPVVSARHFPNTP